MPRAFRPRRSGRRILLTVLGLLAVASTAFVAVDAAVTTPVAADGVPVDGSVQGAYVPVTRTAFEAGQTQTTEAALPDGVEPLTLQTTEVGRNAAEPTVGVTADGTAFFAAGDFDSIGGVAARTETLRSQDGGLTWESVQPTVPDPDVKSEPPVSLDPMVYVDDTTGRVFNLELYAGCSYLLFSDDHGDTWTRNPTACGNFVNDHQTIVSGPRPLEASLPEAMEGYDGRWLYYCFNRVADANCGRSLDGGLTWSPTPQPAFFGFDPEAGGLCGGLHGHIATDTDGRLFLPKGHCGTPWIAITEDGGDSWTRVQVSDVSARGVHLSVTADDAGNLYFVWWDEDGLPWLSVSSDHGLTWGEPLMIAPPGVREVNFPVIEAGDEGSIAITFPGTTETGEHRPWNQYVVASTNANEPEPLLQYATANDPDRDPIHRGDCDGRCGGLWDFQDIVIAPSGELWAAAADACRRACDRVETASTEQVGMGLAVRQIGGPRLRTPPACTAPDAGSGLGVHAEACLVRMDDPSGDG